MKYLIAPDSFKGCLSSSDVAWEIVRGLPEGHPEDEYEMLPMSDGGEGWLKAMLCATGGWYHKARVHDAMMRPIEAEYGVTDDGTAIIESALACGLTQVEPALRNPLTATTYGVGELIAAARRHGCHHFVIGVGGTATSDAGIGLLRALIDRLGNGPGFDQLRLDALKGCTFTLATDVVNPLLGPQGAARVYAPQKGATPEMAGQIEQRAARFAAFSARHHGFDRSESPGAGAGGGLGYALMQYLDAERLSGAELLLRETRFDERLKGAQWVITGEGKSDRQTLMGKLPLAVLRHAQHQGVPTLLIAGRVADRQMLLDAGFADVRCINPDGLPDEEAMQKEVAKSRICQTIRQFFQT